MPAALGKTVRQLHLYINFLHQYNALSTRDVRRVQAEGFERAFAKTILRGVRPRLGGHEFSIARFRSLTGRDFDAVLAINRRLRLRRRLTAFLGHRFVDSVTHNLRHNLQMVLRPYKISMLYSDNDMPNEPVFQTIGVST